MKLTTTQENLKNILHITNSIASRPSSLPITNNVLLKTEKNWLIIKATDLEIGLLAKIRGKIEKEGEFVTNSKILTNLISNFPNDKIELEKVGNYLKINCSNQEVKLNGIPVEDFPIIPELKPNVEIKLFRELLKKAIKRIIFAMSLDPVRPEINGIYLKTEGNNLFFVATDSYRLAEQKYTLNETLPSQEMIIPSKTVKEIQKILDIIEDEEINILVEETQVGIDTENVKVVSPLIAAKFPDYKQIIPQEYILTVKVLKDEFSQVLKSASYIAQTGNNSIILRFSEDKMFITAKSSQFGEFESKINAKIEGSPIDIIFDWRYLNDFLNLDLGEEIIMKFSGDVSPAVFKSQEVEDYTYIIMPIKPQ